MKTRYTRVATMRPFSNIFDSCRRGPMRNIVLHGQDTLLSEFYLVCNCKAPICCSRIGQLPWGFSRDIVARYRLACSEQVLSSKAQLTHSGLLRCASISLWACCSCILRHEDPQAKYMTGSYICP